MDEKTFTIQGKKAAGEELRQEWAWGDIDGPTGKATNALKEISIAAAKLVIDEIGNEECCLFDCGKFGAKITFWPVAGIEELKIKFDLKAIFDEALSIWEMSSTKDGVAFANFLRTYAARFESQAAAEERLSDIGSG